MKIYRDGLEEISDGPIKVTKTREGHTIESYAVSGVERFFATLKGTHFCAHGNSAASAIADAIWKDPSKRPSREALKQEIQKAGKQRKISLLEFRTLTGACAEGCAIALKRAGLSGEPMTAHAIAAKVSREWGNKLLEILEWEK